MKRKSGYKSNRGKRQGRTSFERFSNTKNRGAQNKVKTAVGVLQGNARGFAFFISDGLKDRYVSPADLCGGMHGDTVLCEVYPEYARVVRIIERPRLTGTLVKGYGECYVIPDGKNFSHDIKVPFCEGETGDKVAVGFSPKSSKGRVIEILGKSGERDTEIAAILSTCNLSMRFDGRTLAECEGLPPIDYEKREDFRSDTVITIDGESSKDFDDAVSLVDIPTGKRLWVHIADVSFYVREGSRLDKEALRRGASVYYGDTVIPMLPTELCDNLCSLLPDEDRPTLSVCMDFSEGKVVEGRIVKGVIRSKARLTYEKVSAMLGGEKDERYEFVMPMLYEMQSLAAQLKRGRDEKGNIDFVLPEPKIKFVGGKVDDVVVSPHLVAHSIIEEFMIAANEFVARTMKAQNVPFIYREHKPPSEEKIDTLNDFLKVEGLPALESPSSLEVARLLANAPEHIFSALNKITLRSMSKASYETSSVGHFGLALSDYCHFTSPIRRYPDLFIHRVITEWLSGNTDKCRKMKESAETAAAESSRRERVIENATRKIDEIYFAEYLEKYPQRIWEGEVSGLTDWGIFVELQNAIEGMVRVDSLPYKFVHDAKSNRLVSRDRTFRLGDKIKVKTLETRGGKIEFTLVDEQIKA